MDTQLNIFKDAAQRWKERQTIRETHRADLQAGNWLSTEDPERLKRRMERLLAPQPGTTLSSPEMLSLSIVETQNLLSSMTLERVIGTPDFNNFNFMAMAVAVGRFVGRINVRISTGRTVGYGTGFMVSPRLMLTNHHVLPSKADAAFSVVEFDYQYDIQNRLLPVRTFSLDPQAFFMTSPADQLDFSLVAVRPTSQEEIDLKYYGWSRLIAESGKAIIGEPLNIIQHPKGEVKQVAIRANRLVDLFDQYAHYETDTEPGSSGSPVYNDQWEIVALHHSGVPKMENGHFITKDGKVWDDGMDPDNLMWVANEGIRVSRLVEAIKKPRLTGEARRLRADLLELEPPTAMETARQASEIPATIPPIAQEQPAEDEKPSSETQVFTITIPMEISLRIGSPVSQGSASITINLGGRTPPDSRTGSTSIKPPKPSNQPSELQEALKTLADAITRPYYDKAADTKARRAYYKGRPSKLSKADFFYWLNNLLTTTHANKPKYEPYKQVYPWVDLRQNQPEPLLKSIYSDEELDPNELINADFQVAQERLHIQESLASKGHFSAVEMEAQLDLLEATLPFNCEHVVPQSWFGKKEPMRGDLHHLFACEPNCNSFRRNTPYFDFADFEEVVRSECGKVVENKFEPYGGKGTVARAVLYFLLRYPGLINQTASEYTADRITMLLSWHKKFPVTEYERHRNQAIFEIQGNRNPLVDYPSWATRIDFNLGLG